jgi:putative ABC transport system substrate-binding protein
MKRVLSAVPAMLLSLAAVLPARALEMLPQAQMDEQRTFRLEVLQVTDIEPYQQALDGFLKSLHDAGLDAGVNLAVHRTRIDFDVENGGFWDRVGVLFRIRTEAQRIATAKPDLVLTIGTPATRYARNILDDAHVPVVFTAVANPEEAGCASLRDGGPGVTGATLYTDMAESLRLVREAFPGVRRIGMVHTDDENAVAHVQAAQAVGQAVGMSVSEVQVAKNDSIVPALKELFDGGAGAQLFAVPLDTYYGLRNYEPARDLGDFGSEYRIPVVAFALVRTPGAALYVGADFKEVGGLAGVQAVKILKRGVKPDVLPILRQARPTVMVDPSRFAKLEIPLPASLAARKTQERDGFWVLSGSQR